MSILNHQLFGPRTLLPIYLWFVHIHTLVSKSYFGLVCLIVLIDRLVRDAFAGHYTSVSRYGTGYGDMCVYVYVFSTNTDTGQNKTRAF